jgi:hypothetical protein
VTGSQYYDYGGYSNNGRAYIYTRSGSTWTLKVTLNGPNVTNANFGSGVDVYDNIIAISIPGETVNGNTNTGVVKIYEFDGTNATLKQTINGSTSSGYFGKKELNIDGSKLLISEYTKKNVYLYEYNGSSWVLSETFYENQTNFGYSTGIENGKIIIGTTNERCYVYTYDGTNWNSSGPITASDGASDDNFGESVSMYGDYIVVGASNADPNGNSNAGKSYIFEFDGTNWIEKQIIEGTNANDWLGASTYINENRILIGIPNSDINGNNSGEVRDYKNS